MATTRKYDNGKYGWTDYDEKGNAVAAGTYNAPGTARNPFNASPGAKNKGMNSGAGNLWSNATGKKVSGGGGGSSYGSSSMKSAMDSQLKAQTSLYDQQAAAQAAKIRQALETQTQLANNTKQDYTNQMNNAITTLKTERAKIPGQTATLNNKASSTGKTNAQKIRNSLAQMGLLQSGESASQQLLNDTTVQNNINANDLQGQELDMGYGNQIASAQTDLASKIKQINDGIKLAQEQGDENALMVLKDAQAKIADATANNAVAYNQYAYTAGRDAINDRMTQQQIEARNVQQALDNVYRQSQADLAAKQWEEKFSTGNSQWEREFLANQAYRNASLARSGGGGGSRNNYGSTPNNTYSNVEDANASTRTMVSQIINALQSGATMQEVLADIDQMERDGTAAAEKYDTQLLRNLANSIPVDNWQYQSR